MEQSIHPHIEESKNPAHFICEINTNSKYTKYLNIPNNNIGENLNMRNLEIVVHKKTKI